MIISPMLRHKYLEKNVLLPHIHTQIQLNCKEIIPYL